MATHRNKQEEKHVHEHRTRKEQHLAREEAKQRSILLVAITVIGIVIVAVLIFGLVDALLITPHKVIAAVDGEEITVQEYQTQTRYYRWMLLNEYVQIEQMLPYYQYFADSTVQEQQVARAKSILSALDQPETLAPEVLDTMIDEIIIAKKAEELDITVDDAELETSMQEGFGYYPNGTATPEADTGSSVVAYPTLNAEQEFLVTATPDATEYSATQEAMVTEAAVTKMAEEEAAGTTGDDGSEAEVTATTASTATQTPVPTENVTDEETGPTATITPTATLVPTATPYTLEIYEENYTKYLDLIHLAKVDESTFRDIQRSNLLRSRVYEVVTADVPTTEEQVWVRHILTNDETVANSVYGMLQSGEMSFDELARMFSSDSSAENGGDVGWFGRGTMVTEFEDAAFALTEIGQISEPVQSEYGYHIIQLLGRAEVELTSDQLDADKSTYFSEWLAGQRTSLEEQGLIVIDEALRDRYAQSQPSFNDPAVFEALFGITQKESRQTSAANQTQQAILALTPTITPVPTE